MKVKELLEKLQKADKEAEVVIRESNDNGYKSVFIISEDECLSEDWTVKFCVFEAEIEWDEDDKPLRYEHTL